MNFIFILLFIAGVGITHLAIAARGIGLRATSIVLGQ